MEASELQYVLALQHVPNLGDLTAKKLIRAVGSAQAIFKEKKGAIHKIPGARKQAVEALFDPVHLREAEKEMRFIEEKRIKCLYYREEAYPEKLKHCVDGPILLFQRGEVDFNNRKVLSIVGTRRATAAGLQFCRQLIEELAVLKPLIVSGFAYGIDIAAQRAALDCGLQTLGCLAHGFNQIYPKAHAKYVRETERTGGFLTEFWSTSAFERSNFLRRNRIIAGLSEATVVIESAEKGGSLVTADIANSYNREVFAVPGRPGDLQSRGCNDLIKRQKAHLLSNAADLIYMLDWQLEEELKPVQKELFVELEEEERPLYKFLETNGKKQLDAIALHCKIPTFKAASLLLGMELKGVVRPLPGKLFELV